MGKFIKVTNIINNDKSLFNVDNITRVYCEQIDDKFVPCFCSKSATYVIDLNEWALESQFKNKEKILNIALEYLNSKED